MKRRHLLMGAALLAAAGLAFFADKTPSSGVAEAVQREARPAAPPPKPASLASQVTRSTPASADPVILALRPRAALLGEAGEAAFGVNEGVFLSQNWVPPPPRAALVAAAPPPPPVAPPLPFTYIGKALGGGAWEVFLARAEQAWVVRAGTVIDGLYRVDSIAPPFITLTYLPLNQVQQLNIGVPD